MKPKTKFHFKILSIKVPSLNAKQKKEVIKDFFKHTAVVTKTKGITCLECGHNFAVKQDNSLLIHSIENECNCPKCKTKLIKDYTKKRKFFETNLFSILSIEEEMQCLRYFEVNQILVYGDKAKYNFYEVARCFINEKGKVGIIGKLSATSFYSKTYFNLSSDFSIRENVDKYKITCDTLSDSVISPLIYRNGFDNNTHNYSELELFSKLLSDSKMETLYKTGRMELFDYFFRYVSYKELEKLWPTLKICFRNNYKIKDVGIWRDYINSLIYFGKDINNPFYVCPNDLNKEHDKYMNKKKLIMKKMALEERKRKRLEEEEQFKKLKSKFFGLEFSNEIIKVKVLESIDEFENEGKVLEHCVYISDTKYYLKPDTLILSARVNDTPIETIEYSLRNNSIIQCHGKNNHDSKYHNDIIKLVNKNKQTIKNYGSTNSFNDTRQLA